MLNRILGLMIALSFTATAQAAYEVQINSSILGTDGGIVREDDGSDTRTSYGFGVEIYTPYNEYWQFGGVAAFRDEDVAGTDSSFTLGGMARYNFLTDFRNSIFAGAGIVYIDEEGAEGINLTLQAGKRFAISESITWTPNLTVGLPVSGNNREGGDREGYRIALNILSFSGFLD